MYRTVNIKLPCRFGILLAIAGLVELDDVVVQLGSNCNPQLRRSHQNSSQGTEWLEGSNGSCNVDEHIGCEALACRCSCDIASLVYNVHALYIEPQIFCKINGHVLSKMPE